jgi:glutathione S-transferase
LFKLIIGNRAYSSWSMRGWLACKQCGDEFEELVVPMFDADWEERREGDEFAPSLGKVPILWDGDIVVGTAWRSSSSSPTATAPLSTGPRMRARAMARSMSAEMHSGFGISVANCP